MLMRPQTAVSSVRRARVEIIPLIDVIFFLLATFVLFTLSLNRIESVPVTLPRGGDTTGEQPLTIQVTDGGAVYWDRELVRIAEVPGRLAHYKSYAESPRVIVAGDDRAKFGPTVAVLDAIRRAGITHFSVETRPRAPGR